MIFHQIGNGGCQSYLLGCADKCTAVLIDPSLVHIDRYRGPLARACLRLRYAIDTHTHADHFSAVPQLKQDYGIPAVLLSARPRPYADPRPAENGRASGWATMFQ